jgi:hypothetical protein
LIRFALNLLLGERDGKCRLLASDSDFFDIMLSMRFYGTGGRFLSSPWGLSNLFSDLEPSPFSDCEVDSKNDWVKRFWSLLGEQLPSLAVNRDSDLLLPEGKWELLVPMRSRE